MRLEDYEKKVLKSFLGHFDQGTDDQVPENYFSDTLNLEFSLQEFGTRDGLSTSITLGYGAGNGKVRRFASFKDISFCPVVLILDDAGNLYTYSSRTDDTATTPLVAMGASAIDFSAIKMSNRVYIAFHDGNFGLSGQNLKVYIPNATLASDEFRDAGGLAPTAAGVMIAANGAAGIVNAGTYKIAVIYITSTGFQTQPGPKIATVFSPTTYVSPGAVKIDLSVIPIGPTGTTSRQILITKADLEEYYFLHSDFGGLIANNTATTTTLDFDDTTDLVDSADYLFDILETIPAPLFLQDYNSRLVIGGESGDATKLRISDKDEPESFGSIDGIIYVGKNYGYTIKNVSVIRDVLYAWKNLGLYAIVDNGLEPSEWPTPNLIDQSVSTGIHGISEFFDISGIRTSRDWALVADRSGLLFFDGILRKPPLTDYISDLWETINFDEIRKIVVAVDERYHRIYCAVPITGSTVNNKLLMADYNLCAGQLPSIDKLKWSVWQFKPGGTVKNPTEIGLFQIGSDTVPTLKLGSYDGGGKIWVLDPTVDTDDSTVIESYFETGLLYWEEGMVHSFNAARFRITGDGTLLCSIRGEDNVSPADLKSLVLESGPGKEFLIRFDFQNEKAKLKFRLISGYFTLNKLEVFGKPTMMMRPA